MRRKFFCDVFEAESLAQDRDEGRTESGRTQIIQATARRKELYELVYTTLLEVYKVPVSSCGIKIKP